MQATIIYLLSEQAQRAQMAATGQPVARNQSVIEDVPARLLNSELAHITESGQLIFDMSRTIKISERGKVDGLPYYASVDAEFQTFPASGAAAIEARIDQVSAKCAEVALDYAKRQREIETRNAMERERRAVAIEKSVIGFMADPAARATIHRDGNVYYQLINIRPSRNVTEDGDIVTSAVIEFIDEARRRNEADELNKLAAEQAKLDYISDWISTNGDDMIRQQFEDDLLCRKAALSLIADAAFDAAGIPESAKYDDKFCSESSCPCGTKELSCLPRDTYSAWTKIEIGLPKGFTVEFSSVRECLRLEQTYELHSAGPKQYMATITMPKGPFQFKRTIRL